MNLDVEKCRHLFEILDSRESRKSTVIVSQIPVKEWYDLFKDCTYADACLDRVLCKAYRLEFKGESLRIKKFDTPIDRYRYTDGALHAHHFSVICRFVHRYNTSLFEKYNTNFD